MRSSIKTIKKLQKEKLTRFVKIIFWFFVGASFTLFLISSFSYITFKHYYKDKIYPGVRIDNIDFGNKSKQDVTKYFIEKNNEAKNANLTFQFEENIATVSAQDIEFGYDENLLTDQALTIGRSKNPFTNLGIIFTAYTQGINLSPSYNYSDEKLNQKLTIILEKINLKPVEAVFTFENGRVTEFKPSKNGRVVDETQLNKEILTRAKLALQNSNQNILINIPVKILEPSLTTDKVNEMGIRELIGTGTSTFRGSIENRIYNINLAVSRLNGVLIPPGEVFSFNKTIGDVSSLTGYKQAYVIQNGRTVLGDGGGVCQVSTTFFRSLLNAGLPIVERNQHAYRVSYYEQDSLPGVDAAIYTPNIDLRFKNDTKHHILIQAEVDNTSQRLTFMLYGTSDGRVSEISTPIITSQTPAPEPRYEDDPNLPKGQVKQVDFAAAGAKTSFSRTVTRNGKVIISETFNSNYRPWQAVYLRGTKE